MDNVKGDEYYLQKILEDIDYIGKHMENASVETLQKNEMLLDSMMFRMIQISENSKKLSEAFRLQHQNIPWGMLFGLRNRIVHDYGNVNLELIYETLTQDIPSVKENLLK